MAVRYVCFPEGRLEKSRMRLEAGIGWWSGNCKDGTSTSKAIGPILLRGITMDRLGLARTAIAVALAVTLSTSVGPASAAEPAVFAKPGGRAADLERDIGICEALAAKTSFQQNYADSFKAGGLVGVGIMRVFQPSLDKEKRAKGLQICLGHRGYGKVTLTPDEAAALDAAKTDETRRAWLEGFMAGDIAERVQAALTSPTPDLPRASDADAPFAFGAALIDPSSLTLASGPMAEGGEILTGTVRRRAVAILKQDFNAHAGVIAIHAAAGTLFQEYLQESPYDPEVREEPTLWCAVFKGGAWYEGAFRDPLCFHNTLQGLEFYIGDGNGHLISEIQAEPWPGYFDEPLILQVQSGGDPDPPIPFRIVAHHLSEETPVLIATAGVRGDAVEIWRGEPKFDVGGKAHVRFWDRDLVLTRSGEGVIVGFEPEPRSSPTTTSLTP